jgi:hypothetical protein
VLAKAIVGETSLMVALPDRSCRPTTSHRNLHSCLAVRPQKSRITIRHLSPIHRIEDAEQDDIDHASLPGWKAHSGNGILIFSIAVIAPVIFAPGSSCA